jgi:hypothetical protein
MQGDRSAEKESANRPNVIMVPKRPTESVTQPSQVMIAIRLTAVLKSNSRTP